MIWNIINHNYHHIYLQVSRNNIKVFPYLYTICSDAGNVRNEIRLLTLVFHCYFLQNNMSFFVIISIDVFLKNDQENSWNLMLQFWNHGIILHILSSINCKMKNCMYLNLHNRDLQDYWRHHYKPSMSLVVLMRLFSWIFKCSSPQWQN